MVAHGAVGPLDELLPFVGGLFVLLCVLEVFRSLRAAERDDD